MNDNKFGNNVRTYRNVLIRGSEIGDKTSLCDEQKEVVACN